MKHHVWGLDEYLRGKLEVTMFFITRRSARITKKQLQVRAKEHHEGNNYHYKVRKYTGEA